MKIKKTIVKYSDFIKDLLINTFSFSIYIFAQQLVLMPVISKIFNEDIFAKYIMITSIAAIISYTLGAELGIVRQSREDINNNDTYNFIWKYLVIIILSLVFISSLLLRYRVIDSIFISISILLMNFRLYYASVYRLNRKFNYVLIQNIIFFIGIIIGILFLYKTKIVWIPMLFAETMSNVFSFSNKKYRINFKGKTVNKNVLKNFFDLGFVSFIANTMVYFDKILIFPLLGTRAVNVYYSSTTMSKVTNMVIQPIYGVLLTWIKNDKESRKKVLTNIIKVSIPIVILVTIIGYPVSYLLIKILYSEYLTDAVLPLLPISIGVGFNVAANLLKAIAIKYYESGIFIRVYTIYSISFIVLSLILTSLFGLLGFGIANCISRIVLYLQFLFIMISEKNEAGYGKK